MSGIKRIKAKTKDNKRDNVPFEMMWLFISNRIKKDDSLYYFSVIH